MPHKRGRGTYKGYESPETTGWPQEIRDEVRRVYGAWRTKNPGENQSTKSRGARIAWSAARRKYPALYSRHMRRDSRRLAFEIKKELEEHPWAGLKTARRIASDHIRENSSLHGTERHRIGDLHGAARQERSWAKTAQNEAMSEGKRSGIKEHAGYPVQARDLKEDSRIASEFAKVRKKKADEYDMEAARDAKVTGG